jgi:uncharacterized protein YegP (UPF0339 family)
MHYAEVFRSKTNGRWYYRIKAMNHEVIAQSQSYATRWGARRAVRKNHPDVDRIVNLR